VLVVIRLAVSAWLVYLAVADLRRGEVSNWATVPPLLVATIWRAASGDWTLGVALVVVVVAAECPPTLAGGLLLAGMFLCMGPAIRQGVEAALVVWFGVAALWLVGVLGGADAKAVMTLAALFPGERLGWLLLIAWLGQSLFYVIREHGWRTPRVVASALGALARFRMPESRRRAPALPAVALAGLVCAWLYFA